MENNEVRDFSKGLSVPVCFADGPGRSDNRLQPHEFEDMLRNAWLILSSSERVASEAPRADQS